MSALENRVGLRIGGAGDAGSDVIGLEKFLEFDTSEFSALVVKTDKGSGVGAGEVSELGVSLLMGADTNIKCEWEGTVIIIIVGCKGRIKKKVY
jgi:hypothetical protein